MRIPPDCGRRGPCSRTGRRTHPPSRAGSRCESPSDPGPRHPYQRCRSPHGGTDPHGPGIRHRSVRIGDVGKRPARPFEQRADQADASGRADGRNQPLGIHRDAPVVTVDGCKGLSWSDGPQGIRVGVGLAQELRQAGRVVQSLKPAQVIEVRLLVGDETPRIRDLGIRIAGTEVMDGQSVRLGDGAQLRQRGGHLSGHRDRLSSQRRRMDCVIGIHSGVYSRDERVDRICPAWFLISRARRSIPPPTRSVDKRAVVPLTVRNALNTLGR